MTIKARTPSQRLTLRIKETALSNAIVDVLRKLSEGLNLLIIIVLTTAVGSFLIGPIFSTGG